MSSFFISSNTNVLECKQCPETKLINLCPFGENNQTSFRIVDNWPLWGGGNTLPDEFIFIYLQKKILLRRPTIQLYKYETFVINILLYSSNLLSKFYNSSKLLLFCFEWKLKGQGCSELPLEHRTTTTFHNWRVGQNFVIIFHILGRERGERKRIGKRTRGQKKREESESLKERGILNIKKL